MITTAEFFYEGSSIGNHTRVDQNQLSFASFRNLELLAQPPGGGSNHRNRGISTCAGHFNSI
jgi:hypothetical protein